MAPSPRCGCPATPRRGVTAERNAAAEPPRRCLRRGRRHVVLLAHPAVVGPVAALDDVVVDDRLEPRADVLEPGVEIRRRQVGREVLLDLPAQRGDLLVALRAEVGGPPVETTCWKANAKLAQPSQVWFSAKAMLRGVAVSGLPATSTAWKATAIA